MIKETQNAVNFPLQITKNKKILRDISPFMEMILLKIIQHLLNKRVSDFNQGRVFEMGKTKKLIL